MIKKTALILLLLFTAAISAQENSYTQLLETFFEYYAKKELKKGVEFLDKNSTTYVTEEKRKDIFKNQIEVFNTVFDKLGDYKGYKPIKEIKITDNFIKCFYLIKHQNSPFGMSFIFYKPKKNWILLEQKNLGLIELIEECN